MRSMFNELINYYATNFSYIAEQFTRHFLIAVYGVLFACIVGIPVGFLVYEREKERNIVIGLVNIIQTIPGLAMLAILMMLLGIGANTVVLSVFLYSLLPIIKNTITGIDSIHPGIIDAAKGMGMTRFQQVVKVEFPLSVSVIMGGIRNALVVGIGVAAIGTFIGAGGLGDIITRGTTVANGSAIILAGAIPTALMAVVSDLILEFIEKKLKKETVDLD